MEKILRSVGFIGTISFLPFTQADEIDVDQLISDGFIDQEGLNRMRSTGWIGEGALHAYIANAFDHLNAIKKAADSNVKLFGVFEDDLMLAGSAVDIKSRLKNALRFYPATADMLYLESCHEACSERRFSDLFPLWSRTSGPSCSAAIMISQKGARRISSLCEPIFWGIDNMYSAIIRAGLIEAYVINPTVFLQNGFWTSSIQPLRSSWRKFGDRAIGGITHSPYPMLCSELSHNQFELVVVQISEETQFLRNFFHTSDHVSSPRKAIFISDILFHININHVPNLLLSYSTKDFQEYWILAGEWPQDYGFYGIVLWIDQDSVCFEAIELDKCLLRISQTDNDSGIETVHYVDLSTMLIVHQSINKNEDILLSVFRIHQEHYTDALLQPKDENILVPPQNRDKSSTFITSAPTLPQVSSRDRCEQEISSLLTGVHFIFDGIMYMWYSGKMSGVNKMWYNIVPFMADVVHTLNGTFTHCQSSWESTGRPTRLDMPRVRNLPLCSNLTEAVRNVPGEKKVVFSSYYRIAELQEGERVCNILPLYDFIPERMGVYEKQHPAFYLKTAHIPHVSGFLSLSNSTTEDLQELHGVDVKYVSTSPNRASSIFKRKERSQAIFFDDDFVGREEIEILLNSQSPYLLLIGYSPYSPEYKGYEIFWQALTSMPTEFNTEFSLLIIGGLPNHQLNLVSVVHSPDVPENVLPILYSRASALVYPSQYEGFGMPPIEAIACGCPVILGSFYDKKMRYLYGDDALYGGDFAQMRESLLKVYYGEVPPPERLIARAEKYGSDSRFGWNEVAKHYLEYMIRGPFMETKVSKCEPLLSPACLDSLQITSTFDGLAVSLRPAPSTAGLGSSNVGKVSNSVDPTYTAELLGVRGRRDALHCSLTNDKERCPALIIKVRVVIQKIENCKGAS